MSGSGHGGDPDKKWFVVEWNEDCEGYPLKRVWDWDDWIQKPPLTRPENAAVVVAKDPLDAYLQALKGETINF